MALAMKLKSGDDFYVADKRVVASFIDSAHEFYLKIDGVEGEYYVTTESWTDLMPGVKVSAAITQPAKSRVAKLLVDAPDIFVTPGKVYRAARN